MQVTVERAEGLERKMTVAVPADKVEQEIQKRLRSMAPKVKMAGFRPGKVPMTVVAKRYGPQVRGEVISDLVSSTYYDAVGQEELRPAGMPKIETHKAGQDEGLEYTAIFEVYPEFDVVGLDGASIERPVAAVTDSDVDAMLDKLRKQRATWATVDRAAQNEDQVTVDFVATIDGENFEGGEGEGMTVVLGAGRMIAGFEEALQGAKAGETVEADLSFPEDYHKADIAGKVAKFSLNVTNVEEPVLPEINDEFAAEFGIPEGGVEAFKADVKANMERELENVIKSKVKAQVMDALLEKNSFDIPKSMIDAESQRVADQSNEQMKMRMGGQAIPAGLEAKAEQFAKEGERRVALGLILSELIQKNELVADQDRIKSEIEKIAASYDDPKQVIKWYATNKDRMTEVESLVLEDQIVELMLGQAQVVDKETSFDELVNPEQATSA